MKNEVKCFLCFVVVSKFVADVFSLIFEFRKPEGLALSLPETSSVRP